MVEVEVMVVAKRDHPKEIHGAAGRAVLRVERRGKSRQLPLLLSQSNASFSFMWHMPIRVESQYKCGCSFVRFCQVL